MKEVSAFRTSLDAMQSNFSTELLEQIQQEFEMLSAQVEDKERAVAQYEKVLAMLSKATML